MPRVLDPFRFVLIAVAGWMNQRQMQVIDYLRDENRVLREQLGGLDDSMYLQPEEIAALFRAITGKRDRAINSRSMPQRGSRIRRNSTHLTLHSHFSIQTKSSGPSGGSLPEFSFRAILGLHSLREEPSHRKGPDFSFNRV
jgi:hypothetical protein